MIPGMLVLSIAAGIVWADLGRSIPAGFVILWLSLTGVMISALLISLRRRARNRLLCMTGLGCAALLSFSAGFDRLGHELSRAELDFRRAYRVHPESVRIAEARVRARHSGAWGDELELVSVRAVDGGDALPTSLLLRLDQAAKEPVDRMMSRSERLLWPGAWVRVGLRVTPLRAPRNPGTRDREHRLARRGWAARARLVKPDWVLSLSRPDFEWHGLIDRVDAARVAWRQRVAQRLGRNARAGSLVRALGLGDRSGIRSDTREAFRRLGLSHLLAVSGLHVGFVAGLVGWLFLRATVWVGRRDGNALPFDWALGMACAAGAFYAWLTGFGISVERAALLFGFYTVSRLCLRSIAPAIALAWVAVAILLMDPAALFDAGAQLSFGACSALILGGFWRNRSSLDAMPDRGARLRDRVSSTALATFRASLVVSFGTAPLLIQHGLPLVLLSPVVNVLAIPWTGLLVLPTSLLVVLMSGVLPNTAFPVLIFPAHVLEACVVRAAMLLPDPSGRAWLSLPMLVVSSALALFWIRRGAWRNALLVWIGISLAGAAPALHGRFSPLPPQVVFFEVGQGDASLVQGREAVLLIDTGSGPSDGSGGTALVRGLRALGVRAIDVLAVTHGDLDHRAGAARVMRAFPVEELWLPSAAAQDAPLIGLAATARERGTQIRWLSAGARELDRGDLDIEILWPPLAPPRGLELSRNETSMVLRVIIDDLVFLFAADIGSGVEKALADARGRQLAAGILKVAHHGSRRSSSADFLDAVSPEIAVVSAPCDPTRGLPSAAALERLRLAGASLWWTGRDGAVAVSRGATGGISVRGWGARRECQAR